METQFAVAKRIQDMGGMVEFADGQVCSICLNRAQMDEADFAILAELLAIQYLSLSIDNISDEWFAHLRFAKELSDLRIRDCPFKGDGLRHLTTAKLEHLDLARTHISDENLVQVSRFSRLIFLRLAETQITDAALVHLRGLQMLETLVLEGTRITDGGLETLGRLPNLAVLDLVNTDVTDAGLEHLRGFPKLRRVATQCTNVTLERADAFRRETGIKVSRTSM